VSVHLVAILLLPNTHSYAVRHLPSWLIQYANQIGINTTWNFFSPDPAHIMYYEYQIFFKDEKAEPIVGFIPPQKEQVVVESSDRRMLYAMRFLLLDQRRIERILIPYLCRKFQDVERISIRHHLHQLPSLDQAVLEKEKPVRDLIVSQSGVSQDYRCQYQEQEEGIL
jgi:hypothetical protein